MFMINLLSYVLSDSSAPPRCDFESYFEISEPQSSGSPCMHVYPQVSELVAQSGEQTSKLAHESKPLFKVIPLRRKVFPVAGQPDYASLRFLNPDFARISNNKNIPKSKVSAATFANLEKVERCTRTLGAGQSQSYWLLSVLLSQLKQDGFHPSDPVLFDKNISALSASFATKTLICAGLTDCVTAKRRESFLGHVSFPVSEPQKRELLVSPGADLLFDQPLLEKVSSQLKDYDFVFALFVKDIEVFRPFQVLAVFESAVLYAVRVLSAWLFQLYETICLPRSWFVFQAGSWWEGRVSFFELSLGFPQVGVISLSTDNRRLSVTALTGVERQGRGSLGGGCPALGLQYSLSCGPHTVQGSHPLPFVRPLIHQGQSSVVGGALSCQEGSSGACSSSVSGVLQPIVCGDEGLRVLRPVIDLSLLNLKVLKTPFKMETLQSVLLSVQRGDWMVCLDLKDAYLQVPIHPDSRKYLRFIAFGQVYQFKVLCFGLSMAP